MFVKICGVTNPGDATSAVAAGADAIGLNFVASSSRCIDRDRARIVRDVVPPAVMVVGVFRNHPVDELLEIMGQLHLDAAQLHGDESAEQTAAIAAEVGTVIKVFSSDAIQSAPIDEFAAEVIMVDAATPGSGESFDWDLVGDLSNRHKILLAGGLHSNNVAEAINQVGPWGVDVATGVEHAPGQKDAKAMERFVAAARGAAS